MERYGLDVKWMYAATDWLALDAQAGWTGFCSMAAGWECSPMERFDGSCRGTCLSEWGEYGIPGARRSFPV